MKNYFTPYLLLLISLLGFKLEAQDRNLYKELTIDASVKDIWKAWTTPEGIKSFFAPDCNVGNKPDDLYEIYFIPSNPPGRKGADSMRILTYEPEKMLSFTWNAPGFFPHVRQQRTIVVLKFYELDKNKTKLTFLQAGWGDGEEWDKAYEYFKDAWINVVLNRLIYRFKVGPVDWNNPPNDEEFKKLIEKYSK